MTDAPLSTRAYDEILGRLLSGEFAPGAVFNRRQIAAEMGVSVAPVLEAMLELQNEGLIETLPRRGTGVRRLTLSDLRGQLILREALECQAARLCCGKPIERHYSRLLQMAKGVDATDVRSVAHIKEEICFHHFLVTLADVPALTDAYDRVMKLGLLYAIQVLHPDPASAPRSPHVKLVKLLRNANPNDAERYVRAHAQSGKEALFADTPASAAKPPDTPRWLGV